MRFSRAAEPRQVFRAELEDYAKEGAKRFGARNASPRRRLTKELEVSFIVDGA